jgi:hypothetical protein
MIRSSLRLDANELETRLLPKLLGRVSHVTSLSAMSEILRDSALRPGRESALGYGATSSSYFRSRGCLSLTDLRSVSREQLDFSLSQYYFLNPPLPQRDAPVFFVFHQDVYADLIPWTAFKSRLPNDGVRVVAHTEAGYPRDIPLSLVDEIIEVTVIRAHDPYAKLASRSLRL